MTSDWAPITVSPTVAQKPSDVFSIDVTSWPQPQCPAGAPQLAHQHLDNLFGRAVAEQLTQGLLMPGDPVTIDQGGEVGGRVAAQRRDAEPGVFGQEGGGRGARIGEVAAAAAGDADLLAGGRGVVEQQHAPAALGRLNGAHQPRRAGADHQDIICLHAAP